MDELGQGHHVMNSKSLGMIQKKACFSRPKGGGVGQGGVDSHGTPIGVSANASEIIYIF